MIEQFLVAYLYGVCNECWNDAESSTPFLVWYDMDRFFGQAAALLGLDRHGEPVDRYAELCASRGHSLS